MRPFLTGGCHALKFVFQFPGSMADRAIGVQALPQPDTAPAPHDYGFVGCMTENASYGFSLHGMLRHSGKDHQAKAYFENTTAFKSGNSVVMVLDMRASTADRLHHLAFFVNDQLAALHGIHAPYGYVVHSTIYSAQDSVEFCGVVNPALYLADMERHLSTTDL
eukprot:TRINITY_DN4205_c0_g1_i2.p1 TRINITY_DN4205_c0_g1~~TRINITY_DN4205_c0_g1_i2.p1  ORF type:complete len:164 (+),score=26.01 TRINITY_DN4205_c0_g1_i2:408-899(+)